MSRLAIIIPAYKETYFVEALNSLAEQTVKDFSVYIGDDGSPSDLRSIADLYTDSLDIHYTKFPSNVGSEKLVHQWSRCVDLSKKEEWIWLFSDDDIIDSKAVENFFEILKDSKYNKFDVYRFNTATIDSHGTFIRDNPIGPVVESSEAMAYNLLLGKRGNSMPDHIFSRKIYDEKGGFVFTQYAQGADWAMSILFSKDRGICIIPESKLYWRYSGINISSIASKNTSKMLNGHLQFIEWVLCHFQYLVLNKNEISYDMIKEASEYNLINVIKLHYREFHGNNVFRAYNLLRNEFQYSIKKSLKVLSLIKENTSTRYYKIIFIFNKYLRNK